MKNNVEDSTKGSASINPVHYKGDALVQVWMDSRVLATLSSWLDTCGNYTRFLSEVVRDSLQVLCDHLEDSGAVEMVDDTAIARDLIYRKYRINLNPKGRGMKNALHNIVLSDRRKALSGKIETRKYKTSVNTACKVGVDNERIQRLSMQALDTYNKLNFDDVENVKEGMTDEEMIEFEKRDAEQLKQQNEEMDRLLKDRSKPKQSDGGENDIK